MMIDYNVGGVLMPGLLVFALFALVGTVTITRFLSLTGIVRIFAQKPLIELATFVIIYSLFAQYVPSTGLFR
ncbi:DUF1656 domain-containing protein [Thalassospira sp. MCCC 1A01428]|uniref:DUF1656 domain-containing protein n=1 Tax=Thalassospira sp. MCCC 1A01428 TaxID=1470575 RepID=UPI000A1EDE34|nr:DUF1656 domain-containing protein [Thalassospira sp. MCCC 1A01428]OSQ37595.1 membrane protein [Thalassospira sp. MCCC 1A01428]